MRRSVRPCHMLLSNSRRAVAAIAPSFGGEDLVMLLSIESLQFPLAGWNIHYDSTSITETSNSDANRPDPGIWRLLSCTSMVCLECFALHQPLYMARAAKQTVFRPVSQAQAYNRRYQRMRPGPTTQRPSNSDFHDSLSLSPSPKPKMMSHQLSDVRQLWTSLSARERFSCRPDWKFVRRWLRHD